MVIKPSDNAQKVLESYMGSYNVQAHVMREKRDVQGGARLGCAPWQLGMIAGMLLVFDIFHGRYDGDQAYANKEILIQEEHVLRAASLLNVIHRLKKAALDTADDKEEEQMANGLDRAQNLRQQTRDFLEQNDDAFAGLWSQSAFAPAVGAVLEQVPMLEDEKSSDDETVGEADPLPGLHEAAFASPPSQELPHPVDAAVGVTDELLLAADVKSIQYGYGANGASVQTKLLTEAFTDRIVMQKTLLVGKPVITAKMACERMQSSRKDGRNTLGKEAWVLVMQCGLENCSVARFEGGKFAWTQRLKMPLVAGTVTMD